MISYRYVPNGWSIFFLYQVDFSAPPKVASGARAPRAPLRYATGKKNYSPASSNRIPEIVITKYEQSVNEVTASKVFLFLFTIYFSFGLPTLPTVWFKLLTGMYFIQALMLHYVLLSFPRIT